MKLDRALAKQEAADDVTRRWQNLHPRMKQFLTKDKIEGVNRIIDDYHASIPVPEVVIEEPTPPVTEVEEPVVEVVVEEKKVEPPKPLGPKEFQINRHVNGTIKFSITDKPKHKNKYNKIYEHEERVREYEERVKMR